jgi:phospholipase C
MRACVLVAVVVASLGFFAHGAASGARAADGGCGRAGAAPRTYRHVIWIWMENHPYDAVIGSSQAPYTNRLAAACGLATNYHNVTHPSLPNYIAATSGGTQGITGDCQPSECSRPAQSVFGQLQAAGMTWMAYQESMPSPCDLSSGSGANPSGDYAPKHNPAVYYLPLRAHCAQRVVPLGTPSAGALAHALESGSLPRFSFITPNLCNDTHDCPVSSGDTWLSRWLPVIVSSRAYRTAPTVIFITWDEGEGGNTSDCALNTTDSGCHVATIVVSRTTPRDARSAQLFNHYGLLRTTEQLLGLKQYLGQASRSRSMRAAFHL